jgi:hypothetical protein
MTPIGSPGWAGRLARQVGHPARLNLPTPALHLQRRSHPATPSEAQPPDRPSVRDTSTESGSAAPLESSPWRRAYKAVPPLGAYPRPQPQTSNASLSAERNDRRRNVQRSTSNIQRKRSIPHLDVLRSTFGIFLSCNERGAYGPRTHNCA